MLIGFQKQKDGSEKALLYINSTAPWSFDPDELLGMLKELVVILEAHLTQRAVDGATHCACGLGLLPDGTCPMHFQYITHRN